MTFVHRVAAVGGREVRLGLWVEALSAWPALAWARELEAAVRGAARRETEALAAYLPLLDLSEVGARAGPGRLAGVLDAAREAELEACLLVLESPGRSAAADSLGPPPDPVLESLTLGHRKAAARGLRGPLLDRVLKDPDPRVVAEVLRNPRLRESEVLAIASRRPCPEEVLRRLVRAEAWICRPAVRRAVALNPYAPPRLAIALLPTLSSADLLEVADQGVLHEAVRAAALVVRGWGSGRVT
jgi:hypothetical protein